MIYFTSDTHFGHANIIKYCTRPFADVDEMNRELIRRWNEVVKPDDAVFHLGDFCFKGDPGEYLAALNGKKVLIYGNHDKRKTRKQPIWEMVDSKADVQLDGVRLLMQHKPLEEPCEVGAVNLHGHWHGGLPTTRTRCDAGVDCWGFTPVTLSQIMERVHKVPT